MIEVTVCDTETGDTETAVIGDGPGGYIVTCGPGCTVTHEQRYANETVILTIKPRPPRPTSVCLWRYATRGGPP